MCNYISGENSKEESNIFHHGFTSFCLRSQIHYIIHQTKKEIDFLREVEYYKYS